MIRFNEKPSILKTSLGLIVHRPKFEPHDSLPKHELRWSLPNIDSKELNAYNRLCSWEDNECFPLCFPYVMGGALHLQLLKLLPVPAMGLLHLRSEIKLLKAIDMTSPCELVCRTGESTISPQGYEFEALSFLEQGGEICWSCKATFLRRGNFSGATDSQTSTLRKLDYLNPQGSFYVPRNIGRKYARLCGDYNPIHISTPTAWLFGLKRSIAHGMWVVARAIALLPEQINYLELAFKGPVFTGGNVEIVKEGQDFNLFYSGNPRPVILARLN